MGRAPCCDKANVKRGPWSPEEDATLKRYLETHGTAGNWIALPHKAGLKRCGKSCRLRWLNYLRPDIKHGGFTEQEDNIIFTLYDQMGSRWSLIASHLPGRTDNDVKNYWNTKLKKKLLGGGKTGQELVKNVNTTNINIASAGYTNINNPISPISSTADPSCSTSSSCVQKSETNFSLTFWESLTQNSVTLPILSDVGGGYNDPIVNTSQSLNSLDNPVHNFSLPGILDMSELGSNLINSTTHFVSTSQEGSSISDSTSIATATNCVSLPCVEDHVGVACGNINGMLMDSGFSFPSYDSLLFEEKLVTSHKVASSSSSTTSSFYQNIGGFGHAVADMK